LAARIEVTSAMLRFEATQNLRERDLLRLLIRAFTSRHIPLRRRQAVATLERQLEWDLLGLSLSLRRRSNR